MLQLKILDNEDAQCQADREKDSGDVGQMRQVYELLASAMPDGERSMMALEARHHCMVGQTLVEAGKQLTAANVAHFALKVRACVLIR